jgi:hypothetical protein
LGQRLLDGEPKPAGRGDGETGVVQYQPRHRCRRDRGADATRRMVDPFCYCVIRNVTN